MAKKYFGKSRDTDGTLEVDDIFKVSQVGNPKSLLSKLAERSGFGC